MKTPPKKLQQYLTELLSIDEHSQKAVKQLAFIARALVIATLPHSKSNELTFKRKNGHYTLTMIANPQFGLPYGSLPRMLLAWMTTEAVRTKSLELDLGKSFNAFLKKLALQKGGGKRGNSTRVREQLMRLLTCSISCISYDKKNGTCDGDQYLISRSFNLWWAPIQSNSKNFLAGSKIVLAKDFFDELIKSPVPIDFAVLEVLRKSPLQIDIYIWLTYRFSFLKETTFISWESLKHQFGSDYEDDKQGIRNFKKKFLQALKHVWVVYPMANLVPQRDGISLFQSETHVKKNRQCVKNPVDNLSYPR